MGRLIKTMLAEVLRIIYPKSTPTPPNGGNGGYDVIFQSTCILLVFCHPSVLKMSQWNLSSNDDVNTVCSPKLRVKVAPGWKATVDKIGLPSLLDHTSFIDTLWILGHNRLSPCGVLSCCETPERLCGLKNIARASIVIWVTSKRAKFQFLSEPSL